MAHRQLLVAGRYRLGEPVGRGGMGRVWLAHDELLDREVAVKEFAPPEWMTEPERARLRTRTLREARSAARLNHPNVVGIYDVVHTDDLPWIIMEYVPARSLHAVIEADGPLPVPRAAEVGLAVLDALTAAHRAGILHRDIKPHNVLIGHDGRVVLTDFGLAVFVDDGAVTGPGLIVGSPQYVSPERARDGASTVESDLWSFGATLYAAIEGRSPYARHSAMATLTALATEPPDPPTRAGPLSDVLLGLLRRDPADRLDAAAVAGALRRACAGGDPVAAAHRPRPLTARRGTSAGRASVPPPRPTVDGHAPQPAGRARAAEPASAAAEGAVDSPGDRSVSAANGAAGTPDVPAGRSGTPARRRARRRRAVAAALLTAVLGGILVLDEVSLSSGDSPSAGPSRESRTATTLGGAGGAAGGFSPLACAGPAAPDLPRTPLAPTGPPLGGYAPPPGWSYHRDGSGFAIAVPDGWTYERAGDTLCFREPEGRRVLSVDTARMPSADPAAACRAEARRLVGAGALPGYREVSIAAVPYLAKAADWEYRYTDRRGDVLHATTRWVVAGSRGFAIGWVTREFDWQANRPYLAMIHASFTTSPT